MFIKKAKSPVLDVQTKQSGTLVNTYSDWRIQTFIILLSLTDGINPNEIKCYIFCCSCRRGALVQWKRVRLKIERSVFQILQWPNVISQGTRNLSPMFPLEQGMNWFPERPVSVQVSEHVWKVFIFPRKRIVWSMLLRVV